ncbi:MAG TPA: hypothetical protein VMK66_05325 [Myxococcales bacterium]|nr:hypothetical protein [Myxococcales bacterium]
MFSLIVRMAEAQVMPEFGEVTRFQAVARSVAHRLRHDEGARLCWRKS